MLENGTLLHQRYRILEILGQGGMGAVYRALDERLGVEVAVKENLFVNEAYARQFRREAAILASLRHASLPRVTDHFEITNDIQYLVMDYIEGEDLRQWLEQRGTISERNAIVIGITICEALTYLHTRQSKVIHRDIKPGNIRITSNGKVYLVDFGLVKMLKSGQSTTTGARAMTPGYSPPEQYGTSHTEPRSDIYSLGATLYAALCGEIPEDGLARIMGEIHLTPLRKHNPKIARPLASVIEKAMSVQPNDRYQTAEDFKQALYKAAETLRFYVGNLTVTWSSYRMNTQSDTRPRTSFKAVGGSRETRPRFINWQIVLLFALSSGLLVFGAWAFLGFPGLSSGTTPQPMTTPTALLISSTETPLSPEATLTQETDGAEILTPLETFTSAPPLLATPTEAIATLTPTSVPSPSAVHISATMGATPMGGGSGEIAFVSKGIGPVQIWAANVNGSDLRQITRRPGGGCEPDWSPLGDQLIFVSPCPARQEVYFKSNLIMITDKALLPRALTLSEEGDFDPAWAPDGKQIAFSSLRGKGNPFINILELADYNQPTLKKLYKSITTLTTPAAQNFQPAWSPDGSKIVYVVGSAKGRSIWIMNANGSDPKPLSPDDGYYSHPDWAPDGKTIAFNFRITEDNIPNIYLSAVESFAARPLIDDRIPRMDADFSPDGNWIVCESWPEGIKHSLWLISRDGMQQRKIPLNMESSAGEYSPAWRPVPGQATIYH